MTRSPSPPTNPTSASSAAAVAAAPPPEALDVESDLILILAVLLCALICVVGLVAVARCAWIRRYTGRGGAGGDPASAPRPPPAANRGLKRKALQSLPKIVYSLEEAAAAGAGSGAARFPVECAICLGEFSEGDEVRLLPQCGHGFHVGCIDPWLGSNSSCPSCRQILVVARCQKCGQFPAVPGDGTEAQLKAREDGGNNSNSFLP